MKIHSINGTTIVLVIMLLQTFAERFTSMIEITDLMQAPNAIRNAINIYVKVETNRLQILKRFVRPKKCFCFK